MQKAVELNANDEQAQIFLCNFFVAANDRESALAQYDKVKQQNPTLARKLLGEIYRDKIVAAK
jgi:lipopolysaccharide biosynthesis regulator YciM